MKLRRRKKEPPRRPLADKEAVLCDEFAKVARGDGWIVYPEVETWDLVLVWPPDRPAGPLNYVGAGDQVGVQAKVRANVEVLRQAIRGRSLWEGPKFRAVLVPKATEDFQEVARALGLGVFTERNIRNTRSKPNRYGYTSRIPRRPIGARSKAGDHTAPLWLPPVVPNRSGGLPCPSRLTQWRVQAIKLCLVLEEKGHITRADFDRLGLSRVLWVDKWVENSGEKIGRLAKYVVKPGAELPIEGWRGEAEALVELEARP